MGCTSAAVGPTRGGWGRSFRLLCGPLGNATLSGWGWGAEHQSRADEAVVLGTPPPPGPPLPRAPALALQHPHSAQFRASCVGSGFVRVFFPLECSKTRQRLRKTPSELTGCASTGRNTGAVRQPSPPLSLQPPDCNFAGKRGCSLRAPDAGHATGIPVKFPKPLGKQAPSGRRASLRGYESLGCSSLVAF